MNFGTNTKHNLTFYSKGSAMPVGSFPTGFGLHSDPAGATEAFAGWAGAWSTPVLFWWRSGRES